MYCILNVIFFISVIDITYNKYINVSKTKIFHIYLYYKNIKMCSVMIN